MYCPKCGIHNTDGVNQCQICGVELTGQEKQESVKVFADLMRYPFAAILDSLKYINPLIALIGAPILAMIYFLNKLFRQPFFSPLMNSKTPKYHLTKLEEFKRLQRKPFEKVSSTMAQLGFEPLIDLEDRSMGQGNFQRFLFNRAQNLYGIIHIQKTSGKVTYVTLFAITRNKTYLALANTYGIFPQCPPNLIMRYCPKQSVEQIHQELLRMLRDMNEEPRELPLQYLLPILYNIRRLSAELGIQQGLLSTTGKGASGAVACYHHPTNIAVRVCSKCGTPLCEACYTPYQNQPYCKNCLPQEALTAAAQPILGGWNYAGLGVRALATLIDLIVMASVPIGVFIGLNYGVRMLALEGSYKTIPFILTQLVAVSLSVWYLIVPLHKYGRALGGKLLGLWVFDRQGNIPDTVAALVRFAYLLLAGLFVFPLLGYLVIPFRKTKQGLHDQLAGTYVVTKHPVRKAILSWVVLLTLFGAAGWGGYQLFWQHGSPWFFLFNALLARGPKTEIALESTWRHEFSTDQNRPASYLLRGEQCIVATSTSVQALNMRTGETLWVAKDLPNLEFQTFSQDPNVPLLALQYPQGQAEFSILRIDPASGAVLWKQAVAIESVTEEPYLTFDAQSILVHGDDSVSEYDVNGKLLWKIESLQKQLQDALSIADIAINKGILLARDAEKTRTLTYFERGTGKLLWNMKDTEYGLGYAFGDGQQMLYTNDGKAMLMDLPKQKSLWKAPQDMGYVMAYQAKQAVLCTATSAVRKKDGQILFAYPPDTRFNAVTDQFLVLLRTSKPSPGTYQNELLLVDKVTGAVKKIFQEKPWSTVVYLSEDQSQIYLAANTRPINPKALEMATELLLINKQTFELRTIPVGKNLFSLQFKVFPQDNLVFIPTYQHVGAYKYQ
jgi:uncharacterized RDD family membrane protein YckC